MLRLAKIFCFILVFWNIEKALGDLSGTMTMSGELLPTSGMGNIIRKECETVIGKSLQYVCRGYYPPSIKVRYNDKHVNAYDTYSIFGSSDSKEYFITFGSKLVHDCSSLIVNTPKEMTCDSWDLEFPFGLMECIPFHITISDELLSDCRANKRASNFTAMHYSDISPLIIASGQTGRNSHYLQLFLTVLLILVTICVYH